MDPKQIRVQEKDIIGLGIYSNNITGTVFQIWWNKIDKKLGMFLENKTKIMCFFSSSLKTRIKPDA